jgi:hypothetical protein
VALTSVGFDEHEVLNVWPYDKFELYRKAVERRRIRDRIDFYVDVSQAVSRTFSSKSKALQEYVEDLNEQLREES